ncbi:MAG: T9SS type A sorting domain-containing protein [Bacteroidia bacterium]
MTKNILIISLFIFSASKITAQCLPDNTITKPGFYPKTLPDAVVGVTYNEVIQFKIIKDTTVIVFGSPTLANIDSATITNVLGMPDGLTFKLNKTSKTYTPAETGCANITGTPTKADTFKLKICLIIYAKIGSFKLSQADTIRNFRIVVKGTGSVKEPINLSKLLYPNPLASNELFINPDLVSAGTKISIFNSHGQLLDFKKLETTGASLSFDYPKGLYWVSLDNGNKVSRVKLMKE